MLKIPFCDTRYPVELSNLYNKHIIYSLSTPENMLYWHNLLMSYVKNDLAVLLIRKNILNEQDVRGKIITGRKSGSLMLFADNSPAWAIMQYCFQGWRPSLDEWQNFILELNIPCHIFETPKLLGENNYNAAGWHIAHIEDINDHSDPNKWDIGEIRKKCLRFIHPVNMFPFPLGPHREYAGHQEVKAFIKGQYDIRYPLIRSEFLEFLEIEFMENEKFAEVENSGNINIQISNSHNTLNQGEAQMSQSKIDIRDLIFSKEPTKFNLKDNREGVCWEYTRLKFWKDSIENLQRESDLIAIKIIPSVKSAKSYKPGLYLFTKKEFKQIFSKILRTKSYQVDGYYHFSRPPAKANSHFIPLSKLTEQPPSLLPEPERLMHMSRKVHIYIPSRSVKDWQYLLADPDKQWRAGYSAAALAFCWEEYDGFPPEIMTLFKNCNIKSLQEAELLMAIPEHKVNLPGGNRPSQNDIFILAKAKDSLISITIEGKVHESFGETSGDWLKGASNGKKLRMEYLRNSLGLEKPFPENIRYQLIHRTASSVIEAERFGAKYAMMIVHTFGNLEDNFQDYANFLALFGATALKEQLIYLGKIRDIDLYTGWVQGEKRFLNYP